MPLSWGETRDKVAALFPRVPVRKGWAGPKYPVAERRQYRGKIRYVVGYGHSRLYSHHFSGLVYDRILGYADTLEAALAMMERKLTVVS
jgi:hypothetical protein